MSILQRNRFNFFYFILFIITIGILFLAFNKITYIPTFLPAIALLVLYTVRVNPGIFLKTSVIMPIILFVVLGIYYLNNRLEDLPESYLYPFGVFTLTFRYFATALFLENIIAYKYKNEALYKLGKWGLAIMLINSIFTIISEYYYPGASRNFSKYDLPVWAITHSYAAMYGLPFMISVFLAYYRGNYFVFFLIVLIFITTIAMAGFFTALVISIPLAFLGLIFRFKSRTFTTISIIVVIVFLFFSNFLQTALVDLLPKLPNKVYTEKVKDILTLSENPSDNETITQVRGNVYETSFTSFSKNWLFGSGTWNSVGGHSYWLDKLGFIGIIGTLFYFLMLVVFLRRAYILVPHQSKKMYLLFSLILFILLFFNPYDHTDFWMIYLIYTPALMAFLLHDKNMQDAKMQLQQKSIFKTFQNTTNFYQK